jgi:D-alanine transaminase
MAGALPVACLNGEFLPLSEARVSPLDRAFLFGDAVYEVVPFFNGRPLQTEAHLARLRASLDAVGIQVGLTNDDFRTLIGELAQRNGGGNLVVYLQISRGTDLERAHVAARELQPTVFAMASAIPAWKPSPGITAITCPDTRWARCDIKSTALLANVMQLAEARRQDADEALMLRDGELTEGTTTSVLIVEAGRLIRRPNSTAILPGTTIDLIADLAAQAGIEVTGEAISESRLRAADEIWITSAGRGVQPVVRLDGQAVGDGQPGAFYNRVAARFEAHINAS